MSTSTEEHGETIGTSKVEFDEEEFSRLHPLQSRWTLWYDNPQGKRASQASWASQLKKVATIGTVEDFWKLYNNILPAGQLSPGSNYHFFLEGIEPKWEDPANQNGGKWVANFPASKRKDLDKPWLDILLACIGEAFSYGLEVCGCVVSIRAGHDRIALWTRTASNEVATRQTGVQFKETLGLVEANAVGYQSHRDSMKKGSSFRNKPMYEV